MPALLALRTRETVTPEVKRGDQGTISVSCGAHINQPSNFDLPPDTKAGAHRLVLQGSSNEERDIFLGLGINVGATSSTNTLRRWLIIVPVSLAILLGLLIPTALRRRRDDESSVVN